MPFRLARGASVIAGYLPWLLLREIEGRALPGAAA